MDLLKLRGLIRGAGHTESSFADVIGMSRTTLSLKLNGKACFSFDEAKTISKLLNLSQQEANDIFFTV